MTAASSVVVVFFFVGDSNKFVFPVAGSVSLLSTHGVDFLMRFNYKALAAIICK